MEVLSNIAASLLGVLFIALINARKANNGKFECAKWTQENGTAIAFSVLLLMLTAVTASFIPEIGSVIKALSGLDLPKEGGLMAWFTFGALTYEGSRKAKRKNIN